MIIKFGKYKGQDMNSLPVDYLAWLAANIDIETIREEAKRILNSPGRVDQKNCDDLEAEANRILGEKPIGLLKRGYGKPRKNT